jgi:uncharacterized repeat protein (TIGR01451 family)
MAMCAASVMGVNTPGAQAQLSGSAFGEQVSLTVAPLLGGPVQVASGPLPQVSRTSTSAFSASDQLASVGVSTPLTGSILSTGLLTVTTAATTSSATSEVVSTSGINGANLQVVGLLPLLTLGADEIRSSARLTGCGAATVSTGTTNLVNARLGGTLGLGLSVLANPAPNTVLLNLLGIRLVLNEQLPSQNGNQRTLVVNAVHLSLNALPLTALGLLTGEVILGQSRAQSSCTSVAPTTSADLGVTATASPSPATVGQPLTYSVTVTNHGPDPATGVVFTPTLPAGLVVVSATPSQGTCTLSPVVCNLGGLGSGGGATVQLVTQPTQPGTVTTVLTVTSTSPDPSPTDNSVTVTTTVQAATPNASNLGVTATASPSPATVGQPLTYSVTVRNQGPDLATGVVLTPALPAGLVPVSASPSQGSCTISPLACNLGSLGAGGSATVQLVTQPGSVTTVLTVSSTSTDPSPNDNSVSVTTAVQPVTPEQPVDSADLSLTAADSVDPVRVGDSVVGTFTVSNAGPADATATVLTIQIPDRLTLESSQASQGSCSGSSPLTCNLGRIATSQSAQVRLTFHAARTGTALFQGSVTSSVPDLDPGDNSAGESLTILTAITTPTEPTGPTGSTGGKTCEIDVVPAATLLIPYFSVDLSSPSGETTLFSVINAKAAPKLAKVTLWTDWAVPSLSFNIYLTGYDVQTINVRDLFAGHLPVTGRGTSPQGSLSESGVNFPGCGTGSALAGLSALGAGDTAHLAAWHRGLASPMNGKCAASPRPGDNLAVGYITVDAVNACSTLTPADPGYFGPNGVATDDNTLWGDVTYVNSDTNASDGDNAVHIVAEPDGFVNGDYTFYGRYVGGTAADHRRPLGTQYGTRFLAGAAFSGGSEVTIWRDTKVSASSGVTCGQNPGWLPLRNEGMVAFDEEENAELIPASNLPLAVQKLKVSASSIPTTSPFGWLLIDLSHSSGLFGGVAQGWVSVRASAEHRYSIGQRAVRFDTACTQH